MTPGVVLAFYRIHWGFSVRVPWASAVTESYTIPPPTTIVGSLAAAAHRARLLSLPEIAFYPDGGVSGAYKFLEEAGIYWATAGWLTYPVKGTQTVRLFTGPYRSAYSAEGNVYADRYRVAVGMNPASQLFSPLQFGYTFSYNGIIVVAIIAENHELVAEAAKYVTRLGSKESFVDPIAVYQCRTTREGVDKVKSIFATPSSLLRTSGGYYGRSEIMLWPFKREEWKCLYSMNLLCEPVKYHRQVVVPTPTIGDWLKVNSSAYVYSIDLNDCKYSLYIKNDMDKTLLNFDIYNIIYVGNLGD